MLPKLKENLVHGTKAYPYDQYYLRNIHHAFQFPVHWHEEVEIIYVEHGVLRVKIGESEFEGQENDLFFVSPRELHLMGSADGEVRYYTLLFPMEFISFQSMDELEAKLLAPLRSSQLLFPKQIKDGKLRAQLLEHVHRIIYLNRNVEKGHSKEVELEDQLATRMELLAMVQRLYAAGKLIQSPPGENERKQKELLAYIQEHYTEKMTLEILAREFHLSEKYISRYFVQHFHVPLSHYVQHLRLLHAKALLETTGDAITEIALQSGFPNVSYFIRSFKQEYGMAPLQYRKSLH